jgi:cold shock CspA family protein
VFADPSLPLLVLLLAQFRLVGSLPIASLSNERLLGWSDLVGRIGFIALDGGGKDVFVHISALERSGLTSLGEGQQVIVDVVEGRKGLEAARVRLI